MTDRKLLELAAKAAGYRVIETRGHALLLADPPVLWNPLTDDGDALRLAVKLGLVVESDSKAASSVVRNTNPSWMPEGSWDVHSVNHNGDPLAATRRAITRAAVALAMRGWI
jgi:hypothetical protein